MMPGLLQKIYADNVLQLKVASLIHALGQPPCKAVTQVRAAGVLVVLVVFHTLSSLLLLWCRSGVLRTA
jgi:hypothetical protein